MNKQMRIFTVIIVFFSIILYSYQVIATSVTDGEIEISQSYLEYLELTDEEKEKVIAPRMYDIPKSNTRVTNPFRLSRMLRSSLQPKYSLKTIIPENMIVKNQLGTGTCWAFASLASLESYFALQDYKNGREPVVYDFSEKHMDYATSRAFLNDEVNEFGFNRRAGGTGVDGIPISYLTNSLGAIAENEMVFDGNTDLIDIDEIYNKNVITQVNDIITFPSYVTTDDKTQIKKQMKEHIMNYGAIKANINANINGAGAVYCDSSSTYKINHSVAIIGWDDEYSSKDNFEESNRPANDGAWIAKNSYGTEIGDEGFIYISYEDANVYRQLTGILNAQTEISYENIYQYDELGGYLKYTKKGAPKIYLATEFDKKTTGKEYLTQVSIRSSEKYTCKVYVNPNGTSKEMKDLQQVELKTGETDTFDAGYHTLEFEKPIKIGDNFVVVLEIEGTQEDAVTMLVEVNFGEFYTDPKYASAANHVYDTVKIADGKCFFGSEEEIMNNKWTDASKLYEISKGRLPNLDTTIKAFTTSKILENIEITKSPDKTLYIEGQDFDKTGIEVKGNYANGDQIDVTDDAIVLDGENLTLDKTSVTLSYNGLTVKQPIEVVKNTVESITITTEPTTTEYLAGDDFDATGMIIEATYKDGTTSIVADTDYKINNGHNLKDGQTTVTIFYEGKTTTQKVTVKPIPVVQPATVTSISVKEMPTKTLYIQNKEKLDLTGGILRILYSDGTEKELQMTSNAIIVSGFDTQKTGTQTINLMYEGKTTQFKVEVKELPKPENSNFDNVNGSAKRIRAYYFSDKTKKEYVVVNVELDNISFATKNDNIKYYYYLSSSPKQENIVDWVKISQLKESESQLSFEINTLDISNYEEIVDADTIYLYVKEVATRNDMKSEKVTVVGSLKIEDMNIEEYIDGKKKADVNSGTITDSVPGTEQAPTTGEDETLFPDKIPYAGKGMVRILLTIVFIAVGGLIYLKYKDIEIK